MEQVRQVWFYFKRYYTRFLLCVVSIAIAVISMNILSYVSHIVTTTLLEEITKMGTDLLFAYIQEDEGLSKNWMRTISTSAKILDYSYVANGTVTIHEKKYDLKFVDASYFAMNQMAIKEGRLLSKWDGQFLHRVAVIGSQLQNDFHIGDIFIYQHEPYEIIGILENTIENFYGDDNQKIFLPYLFYNQGSLQQMMIQATDEVYTKRYFREYLSMWLPEGAIDIFSQSQIKETMASLLHLIEQVLYVIACISFVVSMIGISNVMLICVEERKQEIGIRKALGASGKHIFMEFIVEVVVIACIGYFVGMVFSMGIMIAIHLWLHTKLYFDLSLYFKLAMLCLGIGAVTGVIPALMASQKEIVDVLKG